MQKFEIDKYTITGYQDANETDQYSSGKVWDETQIHKEFRPFIENLTNEEKKNLIILTHTPPRGRVLELNSCIFVSPYIDVSCNHPLSS